MAEDHAKTLIAIDPRNVVAEACLGRVTPKAAPAPRDSRPDSPRAGPSTAATAAGPPLSDAEERLRDGYATIRREAELLSLEIRALRDVAKANGAQDAVAVIGQPTSKDQQDVLSLLGDLRAGRIHEPGPQAVRETARNIAENPSRQHEIIMDDFEELAQWARKKVPPLEGDELRERLLARKKLLDAVLPASAEPDTVAAMAFAERQYLKRKYVNTETMYMDSIEDIPREDFFVSEDNYAWDMSELTLALESNDGIMRNPMSREMFSELDVRAILAHPRGHKLKPMQLEQSALKKGIRPDTIDRVARLADLLLADQSDSAAPSRQAIDEFLAYVATLPDTEQKTIKSLKIDARDSQAGQAYDYTIGQAIADAKGNMTCFHKVCCVCRDQLRRADNSADGGLPEASGGVLAAMLDRRCITDAGMVIRAGQRPVLQRGNGSLSCFHQERGSVPLRPSRVLGQLKSSVYMLSGVACPSACTSLRLEWLSRRPSV